MARRVLIVDGHSIIHQWPELLALHRRRMILARDALVKELTEYQDTSGVHVVVVFDGQGVKSAEASEGGGIQIFYSGGTNTADDVVERLAAKYAKTREITVATSDVAEQRTVSSFGAEWLTAKGLRELLEAARLTFERDSRKYRREGKGNRGGKI